ncbi:uncharacterized protein LOC126740393 [Anthonomus grandis grandis]|uniref:uncharacterized protein LOC126740393 n=1 Tax=Anthonomus grandis grandis TaxID=2921223 RepID=UPI002165A670|nr:uncharacterized protein LOC126740393 [Anthonomus grandis grandis]
MCQKAFVTIFYISIQIVAVLLQTVPDNGEDAEDESVPLETKECRERERLVASDKDDLYALVDAIIGQTLILQCRFCNEELSDQPKNWFKIDQLGYSEPHEVQLDMNNDNNKNKIQVNHKHSLIINNFQTNDVGFYYCIHFEDQTNKEKFNFLVDIVSPNKSKAIEKGSISDWLEYYEDNFVPINKLFKESAATEFVYLRDYLKIDAELETQWGTAGPCESCGKPKGEGVIKKTGVCRIKLSPYGGNLKNATPAEDYLYKAPALSCRSSRLQQMFPYISNFTFKIPDFIIEDKCTGVCNPDAEGINKGWKVGKGKGFKYKRHFVLKEGSHITIVCPESSLENNVIWRKNGKELKRGDNSNPHVLVDTFNSLYLIEVTVPDKGNYTCQVDDIRMQQTVIFVYGKSKILTSELGRYMTYLGFILFLCSFCYCGGLVITWRKRHLFKNYEELRQENPNITAEEEEKLV